MATAENTTQENRKILFNAFDMNCVAHQSPGLWTHPKDKARDYNTLDYWVHLAKTLEKGLFDGLFIADVLGTYDVYGSSNEAALSSGAQVPVNDPILLVSAMAYATKNLGFGITAGTAYEHPYPFARRLATLDHLTNGRVGWNVVTGYLPSAAQNMGDTDQLPHDERYDKADEYLEVIYKLLEGSWEDDAVQNNTETSVFTDSSKVHAINHHGKYFDVPGIAITEPSVQRTPVIYQAGASSRGLKFAGENAEAVFINSSTVETITKTVAKIRAAAVAAGRDPHAVKIFAMQTIITGETEADAQAKLEEYSRYIDPVGGLTWMNRSPILSQTLFSRPQPPLATAPAKVRGRYANWVRQPASAASDQCLWDLAPTLPRNLHASRISAMLMDSTLPMPSPRELLKMLWTLWFLNCKNLAAIKRNTRRVPCATNCSAMLIALTIPTAAQATA